MPVRIQRLRKKSWKAPKDAVYVGRPSKWGNPFRVGEITILGGDTPDDDIIVAPENVLEAVQWYRRFAPENLSELRGKDLMCWCPLDQPCHADVLLELANLPEPASSAIPE